MGEIGNYIKKEEVSDEFLKFMKNFVKLKPEKAKEMRKELEELKLMKVRSEHLVKIMDLMPKDQEDLNKIFTDVSLDKEEIQKIIDVVKKFK
mgnify:FL=1